MKKQINFMTIGVALISSGTISLSSTSIAQTIIIDQIGSHDGSGIGPNIQTCQDFEASYDVYDIATLDNFVGAGHTIQTVEMVLGGWNGFVDPSSVSGYTTNIYSSPTEASMYLLGDVGTSYADAAFCTISTKWSGTGFLVNMPTTLNVGFGDFWIAMIPHNDFAIGGQTGVFESFLGDGVLAWSANPGGGFGMPGNMQQLSMDVAYRLIGSNCEAGFDCNKNGIDDCLDIFNGTSDDCNFNGFPDECDVMDGTSTDWNDNDIPDECEVDCNSNGVPDHWDIKIGTSEDCNTNGIPDECDIDDGTSTDWNENSIPDECDDCNENGIPDGVDVDNGTSQDIDGDGIPDECQDCNQNGILDSEDIENGTSQDANENGIPDECQDCNGNGIPDWEDTESGTSLDCDGNNIPDECQPDCDGDGWIDPCDSDNGDCDNDGIPDNCELDCNENGIPDDCDIIFGLSEDCNGNGVPDECDIMFGISDDCNENGVPDECETDCNGNSFPDDCDIMFGISEDCNENGVPDECDLEADPTLDCDEDWMIDSCAILWGFVEDCNENSVPDECDIENGTSTDWNENSIPDECDPPPNTWVVDAGGSGDFDTIQAAVDAASGGDEILILPGTYTSGGDVVVNMSDVMQIWLHSSDGPGITIIDGEGIRRGIYGNSNATIEGLTIRNCDVENERGAGLLWDPYSENLNNLTIIDCIFTENSQHSDNNNTGGGGALSCQETNLIVTDSVFSNNTTWGHYGHGGAIKALYSTLNITNSEFINNSAMEDEKENNVNTGGGGLSTWWCSAILSNCIFDGNKTIGWAGGFCSSSTLVELDGCSFLRNEGFNGGGFYMQEQNYDQKPAIARLTNCVFEDNKVDGISWGHESYGGGILLNAEVMCYINNCTFNTNHSENGFGGGIGTWSYETGLSIHASTFFRNTAIEGGGLFYSTPWFTGEGSPPPMQIAYIDQHKQTDQKNRHSGDVPPEDDCNDNGVPDEYELEDNDCNGNLILDECDIADGTSTDLYPENGIPDECENLILSDSLFDCNLPTHIEGNWIDNGNNQLICAGCLGDTNNDFIVNVNDLIIVIGYWGSSIPAGDLNEDGTVDVLDLLILVGNWGPCE